MQHLKQGVSKTGEIIVNSIPQDQLVYGIIDVDYSIARSNNAAKIGNCIEDAWVIFRISLEGFSDNFELTLHG